MGETFIPTHRLQFGTGKKRTYWLVQAIHPVRGKDGVLYYNAIVSPRNTTGVHFIPLVPESRLKPIKKKDENKRRAKKHPTSGRHVLCPFCNFAVSPSNPFKWCANCYIEYGEDGQGDVWFDTTLEREEYLWAKALARSGGARIGAVDLKASKK